LGIAELEADNPTRENQQKLVKFSRTFGWRHPRSNMEWAAYCAMGYPPMVARAAVHSYVENEPADMQVEPPKDYECPEQEAIIRCLTTVMTFSPNILTATVVGLAKTTYEEKDFATMPILGDALEDAGCTDVRILSHCRAEGPHARGCHVVDAILGKK
jgi:hypothetical protein